MGYIRHLAEQQPNGKGTPDPIQPSSVDRVDVYGNSYEDWCTDYVSNDVDCNPVVFGMPPGPPPNKEPTYIGDTPVKEPAYSGPTATFLCASYLPFTWGHNDVDNNPRKLSKYEHNVTVFDPYIPTPDNPLPVDETDIFFEILHSGSVFSLVIEDSNTVLIPEPSTDVVLTGANTIQ